MMPYSTFRPLIDRVNDRRDMSGGPDACWPRTTTVHRIHVAGELGVQIRRAVWLLDRGELPPHYMHVEVTCGNPDCLNPKHLICPTTEERFWLFVNKRGPNECWEWKEERRSKHRRGYGQFKLQGRHGSNVPASRFSYELAHGPVPEGLFVCHRCDNPPCVNPAHLFAGTPKENTAVSCDQIGPRNWRVTLSCGHSKHVSKRVPAFQTSASCRECASQQPSDGQEKTK